MFGHFTTLCMKGLNFCPDFFDHVGQRLDKKAKVSLKTYDITGSATNNYNTHIAQYLEK